VSIPNKSSFFKYFDKSLLNISIAFISSGKALSSGIFKKGDFPKKIFPKNKEKVLTEKRSCDRV